MNIDKLLAKEAFQCLNEETTAVLRGAMVQLQGKSGPEAIPVIMSCMAAMPQGLNLTTNQREVMLNEILESLPPAEQEQMKWVMKMIKLK